MADPAEAGLRAAAAQYAPGMTPDGQVAKANLIEGGHIAFMAHMDPSKCYTVVAYGAGVTDMDINLLGPPLYNILAAVPGIKVVLPSNAYDAKGLLTTAIRDDDPVIFCEHKAMYLDACEVPDESYTIPFGQAAVTRKGTDVTVVGFSRMVTFANKVADRLAKEGDDLSGWLKLVRAYAVLDRKTDALKALERAKSQFSGKPQALEQLDTLPTFRRTIHGAGLEGSVVALVGDSPTVGAHWATPLSLLFIDGGHGHEPAHRDYDTWVPHVAVGGLLAIHDVFQDPADGGRPPYELWCRAIDSGAFEQLVDVGSLRVLRRVS